MDEQTKDWTEGLFYYSGHDIPTPEKIHAECVQCHRPKAPDYYRICRTCRLIFKINMNLKMDAVTSDPIRGLPRYPATGGR